MDLGQIPTTVKSIGSYGENLLFWACGAVHVMGQRTESISEVGSSSKAN